MVVVLWAILDLRDFPSNGEVKRRRVLVLVIRNRWMRETILLVLVALSSARATSQTFQFIPEVDVHTYIHTGVRFTFQAKETREAGDSTQAEFGYIFDFGEATPDGSEPGRSRLDTRPDELALSEPIDIGARAVRSRLSSCSVGLT